MAGLRNVFFINQIKKTGVGQVLRAVITNRAVETGYHIKEIGIYAVCGNEEGGSFMLIIQLWKQIIFRRLTGITL